MLAGTESGSPGATAMSTEAAGAQRPQASAGTAPPPATEGTPPPGNAGAMAAGASAAGAGGSTSAQAGTASQGGMSAAQAGTEAVPERDPRGDCLKRASDDYHGSGPYEVLASEIEIPSFGTYTLYRPRELDTDCLHPIAVWGNGTGVSGDQTYDHWHRHAASWGIVVAASHSDQSISMPYLGAGVDWLLAQSEDPDSEFYQRLRERAGAAGHSQGGRAATDAGHLDAVVAVVSVQGGHEPSDSAALLCLTGVEDVARERCTESYNQANGPAFLADHTQADHFEAPTRGGADSDAGLEYVRLHTAWYRCFLAADETACALFWGDPCPLCSDPKWARIEGKNLE